MTPRLSYSLPLHPTPGPARKTPAFLLLLTGLTAAALAAAVLWAAPRTTTNPTATATTAPATATATNAATAPAAAVGQDGTALLKTTASGTPIHWTCDTDIHVQLLGPAPDGAQELIDKALTTLNGLSGLHLHTTPSTPTSASAQAPEETNSITIRYQPTLQTQETDAIGLGGATWNNAGQIIHGDVWIKNTSPDNTPSNPYAREVMLHELMHALGIQHAPAGSTEIMAPAIPPGPPIEPGPRDKASLKAAGCPHTP